MTNATMVESQGMFMWSSKSNVFKTISPTNVTLIVDSFKDGVVTLNPMFGGDITKLATAVAGCFAEGSNFPKMIWSCFEENRKVEAIDIEFDFIPIRVTRKNANAQMICDEWKNALEAQYNKIFKKVAAVR